MTRYTRNINVKHYHSIDEIYDSVNNDPKRPGFQIVYMEKSIAPNASRRRKDWEMYLERNGFFDFTIKQPSIDGVSYTAIIIEATPEQTTALKICF